MVALKALSLSGRFSVMVRICSATSYLIVSYAIGCFLPVLLLNLSSLPGCRPVRRSIPEIQIGMTPRLPGSSRCATSPGHDDCLCYFFGGLGHGLCGPRRRLERFRHSEHAEVVEAAADDLHADRKAVLVDSRH